MSLSKRRTTEATVATVQVQNKTRTHDAIETTIGAVQRGDKIRGEQSETKVITEQRKDGSRIRRTPELTAETVQRRDETDKRRTIKATAGTVKVRNQIHKHGTTEKAAYSVHRQNGSQISTMTETMVGPVDKRRNIAHTHGATKTASDTVKSQEKTRRKRERDRTSMILFILLCQLVCFAPYFGLTIYFMATSTICFDTPTKLISDLWASFILLVNSCINPLIYCWKCENIKNSALRHLCGNRRDESQSLNTKQSAMGERTQQMEACR